MENTASGGAPAARAGLRNGGMREEAASGEYKLPLRGRAGC